MTEVNPMSPFLLRGFNHIEPTLLIEFSEFYPFRWFSAN
jgi:hypothetical protein